MQQLTELAIWTRSKAGRAFGPGTLRGQKPVEADLNIMHLSIRERILALLSQHPMSISDIANAANASQGTVRRLCRGLAATGKVEMQQAKHANGPVLYKKTQSASGEKPISMTSPGHERNGIHNSQSLTRYDTAA